VTVDVGAYDFVVKSNADERRCSATNKRGEPCASTVVNADGLCAAHSGRTDMRELGKASARARTKAKAKAVPASLREKLRELDPETTKAACEEVLSSGNLTAKVAVVRFLADLELYRPEDTKYHELQLQIKTAAEEFERKFAARTERVRAIDAGRRAVILEPLGLAELAGQDDAEVVAELARRLAAIPEAVRAEHVVEPTP
jgi:hypothetical protein